MATRLTREQITTISKDPVVIQALEELFRSIVDGTSATTLNTAATKELTEATVLTLSPNDTFSNERVIAAGRGVSLSDTGSNLIIALLYDLAINGGYRLTFNLPADLDISVPQSGSMMVSEAPSAILEDFADNTAALAGGLTIGDLYQTSGSVRVVI